MRLDLITGTAGDCGHGRQPMRGRRAPYTGCGNGSVMGSLASWLIWGARVMVRGKGVRHRTNGHRNASRPRPLTLQADALAAPIFRETWNAGAPLDWTDFIRQCSPPTRGAPRAKRTDRER